MTSDFKVSTEYHQPFTDSYAHVQGITSDPQSVQSAIERVAKEFGYSVTSTGTLMNTARGPIDSHFKLKSGIRKRVQLTLDLYTDLLSQTGEVSLFVYNGKGILGFGEGAASEKKRDQYASRLTQILSE